MLWHHFQTVSENSANNEIKFHPRCRLGYYDQSLQQLKDYETLLEALRNFAPVPEGWFPDSFADVNTLCLACGGGQQAPVFAAAGANVTVMDISSGQLEQDKKVAEMEGRIYVGSSQPCHLSF